MSSNRRPLSIRSSAFKANFAASTKQSNRRRNRMLSQAQRTTILELNAKQVSKREIARVLRISRVAVRKILRANSATVPEIQRPEKAEPYRQQILELFDTCQGNLVRVHEELVAGGAELSYAALTAFCRRHGIGYAPPVPAGQYAFAPGEELQHDTSPHELELGGRKRKVQTASAVLCYSRMLFFQCYPTFRRFDCKVFLTDALRYWGGATTRVMIDNTHVVVLRGTGREMVPVPEMAAFGERFGFEFVAHAIGNANRSARVERPFWFIETNFLAGRTFSSWEDLNQRAREWCDKVNSTYKKHIRAVPRELFAVERLHLKPLSAWIPEVYRLQQRLVDIEGYVALNSNRYSVPVDWIGRRVEVRETKDKIEIQLDARRLVTHRRIAEAEHQRVMLAEHDALVLGFGDAPVRHQAAGIELNLDLVLGLAHLHAAADPIHRHRIAVAVQRHITFDIDQPLLQPVDFRNPRRQRLQMQPLDREQLAGNRPNMFLVSRVDLIAPLPRPLIQILPTGEGAPGQKVGLYEPERPLYARRTVGIANRVCHKLKAETFAKGGHLRHRRSEE